jgi:hypothetical protein
MALVFLLHALSSRRLGLAFLAGCSAGTAFHARQHVGVYVIEALCIAFGLGGLLRQDRRAAHAVGWCLLGYIGVVAPLFVILAAKGALHPWATQTVVWPRRWLMEGYWRAPWVVGSSALQILPVWRWGVLVFLIAAGAVLPIPLLLGPMRRPTLITGIVYYAVFSATAVAVLHGRVPILVGIPSAIIFGLVTTLVGTITRARLPVDDRTILRLGGIVVCLASWLQMYPEDDLSHTFWALSPAIGFVIEAGWSWCGGRTAPVAIALALLLQSYVPSMVKGDYARLTAPYVRLTTPAVLAGMRVLPDAAAAWTRLGEAVAAYVAIHPRTAMLVEGPDPLYATLVPDLENSTPFYVVWPGFDDSAPARARFIVERRPLIFRQQAPPEIVNTAIRSLGYTSLTRANGGELLAPGASD